MSERLTGDFRKFMDKSFLGSWDVPDSGDLILTIDHVERNDVQNEKGKEKKLTIHFKEKDYKPMIVNTTNAQAISKAYGSTKVEDWENKKISIYKATISAFGQTQECLRVRDYPPKSDEFYCECRRDVPPPALRRKWRDPNHAPCPAGRDFGVIGPSGQFRPCLHMPRANAESKIVRR